MRKIRSMPSEDRRQHVWPLCGQDVRAVISYIRNEPMVVTGTLISVASPCGFGADLIVIRTNPNSFDRAFSLALVDSVELLEGSEHE